MELCKERCVDKNMLLKKYVDFQCIEYFALKAVDKITQIY